MTVQYTLAHIDRLATAIADGLKIGDVVCLSGDLGAGKSTLARAIIKHMAGDVVVPSPTFTLVQIYDTDICPVWHMDWYRLSHPDEVFELGIEEAFCKAISLIEWPQKAAAHIPTDSLHITLTAIDGDDTPTDDTRTIHITPHKPHHRAICDKIRDNVDTT